VGMGSLVCGMVAAREALGLKTKIVGVTAKAAPATALSFAAGKVVPHAVGETIADGVSCRLPVEEALGVMLKYVERFVEVDEEEIRSAMRAVYEDTHNAVEGAGAVAVAAILRERDRVAGKRVGAVVTGGNVDREVFASVLEGR
jgi:threonine dehydratase